LRGRPGSGAPVACEVWSLPAQNYGPFLAKIPAPLGIGSITLDDGSDVKGFLAEAAGVASARDITAYGGWRGFLAAEVEAATA
jgi:allophanate hydrolase